MTSAQALITQPIFLVGAERSGTTVLRLMLDHHPQLAWHSEFEYAVDRISETGEWPHIDEYHQWLAKQRIFLDLDFKLDHTLTYPQLINSFLVQKRDRDHKPIVGATVHRHFDKVLSIWPDARFIHIVRDGRDVARSCIGMGWAGNGCDPGSDRPFERVSQLIEGFEPPTAWKCWQPCTGWPKKIPRRQQIARWPLSGCRNGAIVREIFLSLSTLPFAG